MERSIHVVDGVFVSQSVALIVIEWGREQAASWWDKKKHQGCKHSDIRLIGNKQSQLEPRPLDCRAAVSCCLNQSDSIGLSCLRPRWRCLCRRFFFLTIWSSLRQLNVPNLGLRLTSTVVGLLSSCRCGLNNLNYPRELRDGCAQGSPSLHQAAQKPAFGWAARLLNRLNRSWFQLKYLWLFSNNENASKLIAR